jgi:hypothetical protein
MRTAGMHITSTVEKTVSVYVDDCDEEDWYDGIAHLLRIMNRHLRIRREMAGEWAVVYRRRHHGSGQSPNEHRGGATGTRRSEPSGDHLQHGAAQRGQRTPAVGELDLVRQ